MPPVWRTTEGAGGDPQSGVDPESIRKVLAAVELSVEVPGFLPARSPPRQREMEYAE